MRGFRLYEFPSWIPVYPPPRRRVLLAFTYEARYRITQVRLIREPLVGTKEFPFRSPSLVPCAGHPFTH